MCGDVGGRVGVCGGGVGGKFEGVGDVKFEVGGVGVVGVRYRRVGEGVFVCCG